MPYDPESKGGSEATVRIAKADLVPAEANLLADYRSFADLVTACERVCDQVNGRAHRETGRVPAEALAVEQQRLHRLPADPYTAALGETRLVNTDQTVRFGSVRYSTRRGWSAPRCGRVPTVTSWSSSPIWPRCRRGRTGPVTVRSGWPRWPGTGCPPRAPHESTLITTRVIRRTPPARPAHRGSNRSPPRRRRSARSVRAPGPGARSWLIEAAAAGATRVRSKMAAAVELAGLAGADAVDAALGQAAVAGRFADGDLVSILGHQAVGGAAADLVIASAAHSAQPGTAAWANYGIERKQAQ